MTYAVTGSSACTVADRGSRLTADSSPTSAPGPRTARTISAPPAVWLEALTRPTSSSSTQSDLSASRMSTSPRFHRRRRARLMNSVRSSAVSIAQNSLMTAHRVGPHLPHPPLDLEVAQGRRDQLDAGRLRRHQRRLADHQLARLGERLQA